MPNITEYYISIRKYVKRSYEDSLSLSSMQKLLQIPDNIDPRVGFGEAVQKVFFTTNSQKLSIRLCQRRKSDADITIAELTIEKEKGVNLQTVLGFDPKDYSQVPDNQGEPVIRAELLDLDDD